VLILVGLHPASARAESCAAERIRASSEGRDELYAKARALVRTGDYPQARAVFYWLLAQNEHDDEARTALARLDARQGCRDQAERKFREVLERWPGDVDARSGLFDMLLWQGRWDDATQVIERGLAASPSSPELLMRRARLEHWRGDETEARNSAAMARSLGPVDPALERLVQRDLFLGEARLTARVDAYPAPYAKQVVGTAQVLQRYHRLELAAGSQVLERSPITDARYWAQAAYHPGVGALAGVAFGVGAPSQAIPRYEGKVFALAPISTRLSGFFSYAFWQYANDKTVHIFAPALGLAITDELQIDLRWWTSFVVLRPPPSSGSPLVGEAVHAVGVHVAYRTSPRLSFGGDYTYGTILDQIPAVYQLIGLRSHLITAFADWQVHPSLGVRPVLVLERRKPDNRDPLLIPTLELGVYTRW